MQTSALHDRFWQRLPEFSPCRVLEIGTRAWDGKGIAHQRERVLAVNPGAEWVGTDLLAGEGVDVVADVHELSAYFPAARFDIVILLSILEHLARPWDAAKELAAVVRPGGIALVATHQTFPYHAYPEDYYRFTTAGLAEIFGERHGWRTLETEYEYPAKVIPLQNIYTHARSWNFEADAWLNVSCLAERI